MEHVKALHTIDWKYIFVLELQGHSWEERNQIVKHIDDWATDNCQGQWLVSGIGEVISKAPSKVDPPFSNKKYEASFIKMPAAFFVGFEREDEATAFKLVFGEK